MALCSCLCFILFISLAPAQPPKSNGKGSQFLKPRRPKGRPGPPGQPPGFAPRVCPKLKCRNLDGECTATKNTEWGQAQGTQFSYLNGHSSIIPTGAGLKSARDISNILSDQDTNTVNAHGLKELLVFFGQFIDHNIIATPENENSTFPIPVPTDDEVFPPGTSLPFFRSVRGLTGEGSNERPINTLSSVLDLVAVYGPNDVRNSELVEKVGNELTGKLKTSKANLLPLNTEDLFNAPDASSTFFVAGDHRANEHVVLTALHTIFVREHNRLCDKIKAEQPSNLDGTEVYEYARKHSAVSEDRL